MFLGPFCLAVHKGKEGLGGGEYDFSAPSHKEILYCFQRSLSTNASCHRRSVLRHFDTAVQDTAVLYEIVALDSVQEDWNWAKAIGLIFCTHAGANCEAKIASVGSSQMAPFNVNVHVEDEANLAQSCLEGRGLSVCLSVWGCAAVCCLRGRSKRNPNLHGTPVDFIS